MSLHLKNKVHLHLKKLLRLTGSRLQHQTFPSKLVLHKSTLTFLQLQGLSPNLWRALVISLIRLYMPKRCEPIRRIQLRPSKRLWKAKGTFLMYLILCMTFRPSILMTCSSNQSPYLSAWTSFKRSKTTLLPSLNPGDGFQVKQAGDAKSYY